jgi:two-component system CheB/CheR fusion protein
MPPDIGMAFVVISHLDPTHKGILPELLQRSTKMKVSQADDGMEVRPNCVYIIPPNKDISILHGTLQLLEPTAPRGLRTPIDFFFRHLAEDQKEKSICIILSGMGTDGTLGLKTIKENFGMVMAQDPSTAKFEGMPQSAIGTGLVDYIAPAEELPARLMSYVNRSSKALVKRPPAEGKPPSALQKIFVLLRAQTGQDFSFYKSNTIYRRVERRMHIHQIADISQYVRYLQHNPHEIELLFKELIIGVTNFFRDPEAFEVLKQKIIPQLLKGKTKRSVVRIWVSGCSTGEEAYSIAIIFSEYFEELKQKGSVKIQIFATDIDRDAIDKARQGVYPANISADVSPERLERFFIKDDARYRIKKEIREMVVFAQQNIIMDPPFTKLDLLCCRNLLIYLTPEMHKRLLPLFHYSLYPGGILFLGSSESIGSFNDLFSVLDNKWKIFKSKETSSVLTGMVDLPSSLVSHEVNEPLHAGNVSRGVETNIPEMTQRILLEKFAPPAVLVNEKGDIVYITGRTGKYLEPAVGKANMNIFAMAREGLRHELGNAIRKAMAKKTEIIQKEIRVKTDSDYRVINLTVKPISEPEGMRGLLMIVFEDVMTPPKTPSLRIKTRLSPKHNTIIENLETDLKHTKETLQSTIEEMETTQEELKSANEELQSTNEELQSTNEELTTSKEEMQSLNEELMTVNNELQAKVDELSQSNNDMRNLLNSTDIATIFLDNDLNVKRFTSQATRLINLIQTDVGRPITHLVTNLHYQDLLKDVKEVLETLVFREIPVQTKDNHWYLMRIMPYRTIDNVIDGAVMTFTDITVLKHLEESLQKSKTLMQEARNFAENIIATIREPLVVLDTELRVVSASRSFYRTFQVTPEETEKQFFYDLGNRQWDIPALRELLEEILPRTTQLEDFRVEHDFPKIGRKKMLLNARQIHQEGRHAQLFLLAIEDITDKTVVNP